VSGAVENPRAHASQPDRKSSAQPVVDADVDEARPSARASAADRHVGSRIRERRVMLGLSQQQLAQMIGVTYQQAHKYERGLNRISAGRLYEIAQVLNVPVSWFFEGLSAESLPLEMTPRQRMCLELARNFAAIDNEKHQEALSAMARALAAQSQNGASTTE
jgi:transcriptional regulator with XRE-family HTH domain